ncbi:MAG: hypothetical protein ACP5E4_01180 [Candidatus Aenigmatarchaeota archaeon]
MGSIVGCVREDPIDSAAGAVGSARRHIGSGIETAKAQYGRARLKYYVGRGIEPPLETERGPSIIKRASGRVGTAVGEVRKDPVGSFAYGIGRTRDLMGDTRQKAGKREEKRVRATAKAEDCRRLQNLKVRAFSAEFRMQPAMPLKTPQKLSGAGQERE